MFGLQKVCSFHAATLAVSQYTLLVAVNPVDSLDVLALYLGIAAAHDKLSIVMFLLTPLDC
jgi:hypothetical protein